MRLHSHHANCTFVLLYILNKVYLLQRTTSRKLYTSSVVAAPCTTLDTMLLSSTWIEIINAPDSAQQVDWDLQELYCPPWPW